MANDPITAAPRLPSVNGAGLNWRHYLPGKPCRTCIPAIALGLTLAVILLLATFVVVRWDEERHLVALRAHVTAELSVIRERFLSAVDARSKVLDALARQYTQRKGLEIAEFDLTARALTRLYTDILVMGLAPLDAVAYVYPWSEATRYLGHDIVQRLSPQLLASFQEAVASSRPLCFWRMEGTIPLLYLYQPMIASVPGLPGDGPYLGAAFLTMDPQKLYQATGLEEASQTLLLTIFGTNSDGTRTQVLYGPADVLDQNPVSTTLAPPANLWSMAAVPRGGWKSSPYQARIWIGGTCLALLVGILAMLLRKQLQERLASEQRYRELVHNARSLILRLSPEGRITFFNEYAQQFFGYTAEEVENQYILGLLVPELDTAGRDLKKYIHSLLRSPAEHTFNENENLKKNGERVWIAWANRPVVDAQGRLVEILSVGTDITARKRAETKLRELAVTDGLTHLLNRRAFMDQAQREFLRAKRFGHHLSLCVLDIDLFKLVNDTYGHHAGDLAIRRVADLCRQAVRAADILGRLGGEEYGVLLLDAPLAMAEVIGERIRASVADLALPLEQELVISLTVSVGVATLDPEIEDFDGLLRRADQAMYRAKHAGRNRVVSA